MWRCTTRGSGRSVLHCGTASRRTWLNGFSGLFWKRLKSRSWYCWRRSPGRCGGLVNDVAAKRTYLDLELGQVALLKRLERRLLVSVLSGALPRTLKRRSGCFSMAPAAAPRLALSLFSETSDMASSASSRFVALNDAICASISSRSFGPALGLAPLLLDGPDFLPGVLASSSSVRRASSAFFFAFSAAFSARSSALLLPLAPCCHLAASSASAAACFSAALRSAASCFRARPATALGFTATSARPQRVRRGTHS